MKQEDVDEVMSKPISQELLGGPIPARLAYVGIDGDPRVVPIGYVWDGSAILMFTVLFVCTGNVCRSPMAEALLRRALASHSVEATVSSAGLLRAGMPAAEEVIELMDGRGLDLRLRLPPSFEALEPELREQASRLLRAC